MLQIFHKSYLGDMMHGCDGQPPAVLPLRQVEQGDDGRPLVPVGVDRHDGVSASLKNQKQ